MGKYILLIIIFIAFKDQDIEKFKTEKREFIITGIEAPRNFRVTLKDVKNRRVYKDVFVSKRCDNWIAFRVGDKIKLKITTVTVDGKNLYEFKDIEKVMCK